MPNKRFSHHNQWTEVGDVNFIQEMIQTKMSFGIRTTELNYVSIKQWILSHITATNILDQMKQSSLQSIFTILWTIWTHRNLVLHNGKTPNPVEVILTSQSLICKYKEVFNQCQRYKHIQRTKKRTMECRQNWQLLIKVAATRNKRSRRSGFAVELGAWMGQLYSEE